MAADENLAPPETFAEALAQWAQIRSDLLWLRAMRNAKFITKDGEVAIQYVEGARNTAIDIRTLTPTGATSPTEIPSQTGNSGLVLGTDGTTPSWVHNGATLLTSIKRSATQSINNATFTNVSFDGADDNNDGLWSASSPTRITVPAGQGGIYSGYALIPYAANGTGARYAWLIKNGTGTNFIYSQAAVATGGLPTYASFAFKLRLAAADYLQLQAYQDSGGSLNIASGGVCYFVVAREGD